MTGDAGRPDTERISTNWLGPTLVVVVSLAVIGVLAWKPWDRPSPVPSPAPIAAPTPTAPPTPTAAPTMPPTPTPPRRTPSPTAALAEIDVRHGGGGGAFVQCEYKSLADGERVLAQLEAGPPYVQLNPLVAASKGVRRVAWRAELQVNRLETLFSADWETVARSRRHFARDLSSDPLAFGSARIDYDKLPVGTTLVVRALVVVEWFGPDGMLDSRSVVATTYGQGGGVLAEGCLTSLG